VGLFHSLFLFLCVEDWTQGLVYAMQVFHY
jgi:hypothetical protein